MNRNARLPAASSVSLMNVTCVVLLVSTHVPNHARRAQTCRLQMRLPYPVLQCVSSPSRSCCRGGLSASRAPRIFPMPSDVVVDRWSADVEGSAPLWRGWKMAQDLGLHFCQDPILEEDGKCCMALHSLRY